MMGIGFPPEMLTSSPASGLERGKVDAVEPVPWRHNKAPANLDMHPLTTSHDCWIFMLVFCALKCNQQWWSLHWKLSFTSTCQVPWNPLKMNTNTKHTDAMEKNDESTFSCLMYLLLCWIFMLPFCAQKDYHYQKAQSSFESCIIYLVTSPRCTCQKRKACCEFTKLACN